MRRQKSRSPAAAASARRGVMVELTPAQVNRVVRSASETESISLWLAGGLDEVRRRLGDSPQQFEDARLSRSLLLGLFMLTLLPSDGGDIGNAELAAALGEGPSTTHRYLSTLVAVGLVERDAATRRYRRAR
jgi:uncharacterized membrane protein